MKKTQLASAISMALLSMGTVGSAQAQEAGVTRGLEQVIVQARRVEENVQDVPLAITALSGEQLEKAGITDVADLAQSTPSVQVSNAIGRQEATYFAIRGQRADDILLTGDQAVAVIVGGVPFNWSYGSGMMGALDVGSLEVAKGPQGTLFGKNSTGGAIIITPAEPEDILAGKIKVGVGNYDQKELEGMINVPLTETLAARFAASATQRDGWGENLDAGDDFNATDMWSVRASLKWQPTDALSSLFVVEAGRSASSAVLIKSTASNPAMPLGILFGQAEAAQANDDFWEGRSDLPDGGHNDMKTWGVLNTTTFEVSPEITIKNIIGVRDLWYEGIQDNDGTNGAFIDSNTPQNQALINSVAQASIPANTPNRAAVVAGTVQALTLRWDGLTTIPFQFVNARSVTEELQIIGSHDIVDWIGGLYFARTNGQDGAISQQYNSVGNLTKSGPTGGILNQTFAMFGQATWHLTDDLNLTTGLRYTVDNREVTYQAQQYANPVPGGQAANCLLRTTVLVAGVPTNLAPSPCELEADESFHEPTWNITLDYKLTDSQLVYVAHRHGYRSGGLPGRGQSTATSQPFDPEIVDDIELGYKIESDIVGMPYRVNAAVFMQDYQDIQRNVTIVELGTLATTTVNAASGTIQGGEVEFTLLPLDSLELTGYYSYVDAKYEAWDQFNPTLNATIDRKRNEFPAIPMHSAGLTARYTLPLPTSVGDVSVAANAYHQTRTAGYVDNQVDSLGRECQGSDLKGYTLFNARLDWENLMGMEGVNVTAWGKNLTEEEYYTGSLCLYNLVGDNTSYPGEPRTFGVSAQYKF